MPIKQIFIFIYISTPLQGKFNDLEPTKICKSIVIYAHIYIYGIEKNRKKPLS